MNDTYYTPLPFENYDSQNGTGDFLERFLIENMNMIKDQITGEIRMSRKIQYSSRIIMSTQDIAEMMDRINFRAKFFKDNPKLQIVSGFELDRDSDYTPEYLGSNTDFRSEEMIG